MPDATAELAGSPPETEPKTPFDLPAGEPEAASESSTHGLKPFPVCRHGRMVKGRREVSADQFFGYWLGLAAPFQKRATVYVYRKWPVWDALIGLAPETMEEIARHKRKGPPRNIEKWIEPPFAAATDWRQYILDTLGAGRYAFLLNDEEGNKADPKAKGKWGSKPILGCELDKTLGSIDQYPPVLDFSKLDMGNKENESYIRWCQAKGVRVGPAAATPEQTEEDDNDMAVNAESVKVLSDAVVSLANQANNRREDRPAPQPAPSNAPDLSNALSGMVTITGDVMKQGTTFMKDAMETVVKSQVQQGNPMEHTKQVMELATKMLDGMAPKGGGNDGLSTAFIEELREDRKAARQEASELRKMILEMQNDRMKDAEKRAEKPVDEPGSTPLGRAVKELSSVKEFLDELGGKGGDDDEVSDRAAGDKLTTLMQIAGTALPQIFGSLERGIYNVLLLRGNVQGQPSAPAAPGQPVLPSGANAGQNGGGSNGNPVNNLLAKLHDPLILALRMGRDGASFAAEFVSWNGKDAAEAYTELQKYGPAVALQLFLASPLGHIAHECPSGEFERFVGEFMDGAAVQAILSGQAPPQRQRRVVKVPGQAAPQASPTQ